MGFVIHVFVLRFSYQIMIANRHFVDSYVNKQNDIIDDSPETGCEISQDRVRVAYGLFLKYPACADRAKMARRVEKNRKFRVLIPNSPIFGQKLALKLAIFLNRVFLSDFMSSNFLKVDVSFFSRIVKFYMDAQISVWTQVFSTLSVKDYCGRTRFKP